MGLGGEQTLSPKTPIQNSTQNSSTGGQNLLEFDLLGGPIQSTTTQAPPTQTAKITDMPILGGSGSKSE